MLTTLMRKSLQYQEMMRYDISSPGTQHPEVPVFALSSPGSLTMSGVPPLRPLPVPARRKEEGAFITQPSISSRSEFLACGGDFLACVCSLWFCSGWPPNKLGCNREVACFTISGPNKLAASVHALVNPGKISL